FFTIWYLKMLLLGTYIPEKTLLRECNMLLRELRVLPPNISVQQAMVDTWNSAKHKTVIQPKIQSVNFLRNLMRKTSPLISQRTSTNNAATHKSYPYVICILICVLIFKLLIKRSYL